MEYKMKLRPLRTLDGARPDPGPPRKAKGVRSEGRSINVASAKCLYLALLLALLSFIVFSAGAILGDMHPNLMHRPRIPDAQAQAVQHREDVHMQEAKNRNVSEGEMQEDHAFRLPAGQHLLVDINHADPNFLSSEELLTEATYELIRASNQVLLSFHCLQRAVGVSCAGLLKESHITLRTWPDDGVILLDLFTRGREPLISVLPIVEKLFAVPNRELFEEPRLVWSHQLRGFREDDELFANPFEQDLGQETLQKHRPDWVKTLLASDETNFQQVDVYELEKPNSLPNKVLYLDGFAQSSLLGEIQYHEALVHPAMISHPNPRRVAIIGGAEGATLREVLKHKSVEKVVMVEIDSEEVDLCEEYLPEWSDCSDFSDEESCFDDERATVTFADAFGWFIDRYRSEEMDEEKFDAIVMDALDPDKFVGIVGSLYKSDEFVRSLFNGLSEEGVFVMQSGQCDSLADPAEDSGPSTDEIHMFAALKSVGFQSSHYYAEAHSHYLAPWCYLLMFKDAKSRANWYKTSAEIEVELHKRLIRTKSGKPALRFFDASTMLYYQLSPKPDEATYCRKQDTPWECDGFEEYIVGLHTDPISGGKSCLVSPNSLTVIEDLYQWASKNNNGSLVEDELASAAAIAQDQGSCHIDHNVVVFSPAYERHLKQVCARVRL